MVSVYSDTAPVEATTTALRFSPSAADRWFRCPGSAWVSAVLRSTSSVYAREGTAAHGVLETALGYPDSSIDDLTGLVGREWHVERHDPDAVHVVDGDMVRHAVESRKTLFDFFGVLSAKPVQKEVVLRYTNRGLVANGRADTLVVDDHMIATVDYKYGAGEIVEAKGHLPTIVYLCSLRQKYGRRPWYYAGILQPRGRGAHPDRIKTWVVSDAELDKLEVLMVAAMDRARMYPVPFVSGDWCKYCPGKGTCPAWAMDAVQALLFRKANATQPNLWLLEHASAIKKYLGQLEKDTIELLRAGGTVPGWTLSREPGNRMWVDDVEQSLIVRAIESGWSKADVIKTKEAPIGITEAEKLGISTDGLTRKREVEKLMKRENARNKESAEDSLKGF